MTPVAEEAMGEFLERTCPAVAGSVAKEIHQMDDLVLEDPLQHLQAACAGYAGDGDPGVGGGETVEEDLRGDGDLVVDPAIGKHAARGLPAGPRHPRGQAEPQGSRVQPPTCEASEEPPLVDLEEKGKVVCMDGDEVGLVNPRRRGQEFASDLAGPRLNPFATGIKKGFAVKPRRPWCSASSPSFPVFAHPGWVGVTLGAGGESCLRGRATVLTLIQPTR